jgi:Amt family ammonium transporter
MMQSFISMGVVTLIWVFGGFSLAFGPDVHGIIGNFRYFLLNGVGMAPNPAYGPTIPFVAFFVYQEMFAIITPALITGAFADRVNFKSYLKFLVLWSILIYIPLAHWIWGGGWLAKMGVVDFAGGIVVHVSAGIAALGTVFFVGKRKLKPGEKLIPHNVTFVALGTGLLWFGWFGFNGGSALAANGLAGIAFANTDIAGSTAMIVWLLISWIHEKRPSFTGALTGSVAGLATITPGAGYVQPWAAVIIGLAAGAICYMACQLRSKLQWDDALDVWACHGVGGILGSILVGVFAFSGVNKINGLIHGDLHQFIVQIFGVIVASVYAFVVTMLILKVISLFESVRVSEEEEAMGLDEALIQESAYDLE